MRVLKSLAEIAFDAFQSFAEPTKRYVGGNSQVWYQAHWKDLTPVEKEVFERMATRVHSEVVLRQSDGELPLPTTNPEGGQSLGSPPDTDTVE